jgi:predicted phosphodiesterase
VGTLGTEQPVAVLSDVHGNRWALEAVFEELDRRGVRRILNLGDCLYGPLDPAGTAELLMQRDIRTVRGNEDRLIVESPSPAEAGSTLSFVRRLLDEASRRWLGSLPATLITTDGLLLCHGSPRDDTEYLLFEINTEGARVLEPAEVQSRLGPTSGSVVLCGHDHLQRTLPLPDGRLVVDPGSVGLPAYRDDLPHPHVMAAGSPHARCSLLRPAAGVWNVEHVCVEYDWDAAALAAERNGRPDWARALATGRVG